MASSGERGSVLITGAGGFIGGWVAREFLDRGWPVAAVVHRRVPAWLRAEEQAGRLRLLRADLGDAAQVMALGAGLAGWPTLAAVIHCAGRASDVGWARDFRHANLDAVRHVGQLAVRQGSCRFVFLSTTDVYGLKDHAGEDEDRLPLAPYPANPYPRFKVEAEHWIRSSIPADRHAILRPAQVWGVGDTTLTGRIVDFLAWSPWIVHFGKWRGMNRWPLAHVRNLATACYLAATVPSAAGTTINVLDDERTTIDTWYRMVADLYFPGKRFKTVTLPMALGAAIGIPVEGLSNALNLHHPFIDPSYYAMHAVSANLDFSNSRLRELFTSGGCRLVTRNEGLAELRRGAPRSGGLQPPARP